MKRILFSPVGSTDPIRNLHDGSMLHITRQFQPDVVYLYLSREMSIRENKDHRYTYCLERLAEKLEKNIEVHCIFRTELVNVQDYEIYYEDFRKELAKIHEHMEEGDELLVNMASGTPAMKSAFLILHVLGDLPIKPIQVVTPLKRSNYIDEDSDKYDVVDQWDSNMDNDPSSDRDSENRCEVIRPNNLIGLVKVNIIKKHLESYNYTAAYEISQDMSISDSCRKLLKMAKARMDRNIIQVNSLAKELGYQPMPVTRYEDCVPMEYLLSLQAKQRRGTCDDFFRGLSPIIMELFDRALQTSCHISYHDFTEESRNGSLRWSRDKLDGTDLLDILISEDKSFRGFDYGTIYSRHLKDLILALSNSGRLKKVVEELRATEEAVRNKAAHEMVSITDEDMRRSKNFTSAQVMDKLKELAALVKLSADDKIWDSYDEMNKFIIEHLVKDMVSS